MPVGRVPSQSCRSSGPDRPVTSSPGKESTHGHAGRPRRARHRGRHPQGHPHRRGRDRRHRSGRSSQATVPATPAGYRQLLAAGRPAARPAGVGDRGHRRLRRRPDPIPARPLPSRWWSWTGPSGPPAATAPSPTRSTPTRAAREALGRDRLAQPRAAGQRAALAVRLTARRSAVQAATDAQRQLHALVVAAPDTLRGRLRGLTTAPSGQHLRPAAPAGRLGSSRPPPPRPACAPWLAASNS